MLTALLQNTENNTPSNWTVQGNFAMTSITIRFKMATKTNDQEESTDSVVKYMHISQIQSHMTRAEVCRERPHQIINL